jgi:DNA-binding phage protein
MSQNTQDPILKNILENSRSYDEWLLQYLKENPEATEAYLETGFEEYEKDGDAIALLSIISDVVNAHGGIDHLAQKTGIPQKDLSILLNGSRALELAPLSKILSGLGFHLQIVSQVSVIEKEVSEDRSTLEGHSVATS